MAFYTVLTPPEGTSPSARERAESAVFLKDGFVVSAFVFTGLWLLSKRLWLAFAVFLAVWAAVGFGGRALGLHPMGLLLVQALIGVFLGLEGHGMIERKLIRKGWRFAGVVEGRDIDLVERRFFEQDDLGHAPGVILPAATAAPAGMPARPFQPTPVLGLFPDAQGRT